MTVFFRAGGTISAVLTAPLDVLKTRLQSDFYQGHLAAARSAKGLPPIAALSLPRASLLHVRETFQILFAIPKIEGYRALFKGLGPILVGVVPARSINFFTYGNGKRVISQKFFDGEDSTRVHLLAAANAGIVTATATCPIWVVKTRLQLDKNNARQGVQSVRRYRNALDCSLQTLRQEGIRGLYRGLGASYLGVTESTMQWVLYERFKMALARRKERLGQQESSSTTLDSVVNWSLMVGSAGAAKCIAAISTYPHEVVRTRLRLAPQADGKLKYTSIIQCVKLIWKEEGFVALYGGLVPHMLRVVPNAAIMFGCYEAALRIMGTDSAI